MLNPFVRNGLSHLDESTLILGAFFILISFFDKIFVSKQNNPRWHFAASHLGLFCLPMSHKKDARLIRVQYFNQIHACYHACVIIEHRQIIRP